MTPTYPNSSSSSPFPEAVSSDQQFQVLYTAKPQDDSSSLSSHVFNCSFQDQRGSLHRQLHQLEYQQQANNFRSHGGSHDHSKLDVEDGVRHERQSDQTGSGAKWMSSKMRLMKKMIMKSDRMVTEAPTYAHQLKFEDHHQKQQSSPMETDQSTNNNSSSNSNNNDNPIRVCADCNTTKTPLWRSGPRGPKSLCNACGIRQRKARRRAMAAAANDTIVGAATSPVKTKVQQKDKRSNNGHGALYKKRSKVHAANPSHFEDFLISLSKNLAFHQVFPQDEKEAAILLMAISCGLVHG